MGFLSDFIGEVRMNYYRDHAYFLGASPRFFYHVYSGQCLQVDKMIISSPTKDILDRKISSALGHHKISDFYDFSLAMGKFTGVYNVWNYQPLSYEMRQKIATMQVDSSLVENFLSQHLDSIVRYFQDFYGISSDQVQQDISMIFSIVDDDSIYRSVVCQDVGKILIATSLSYKNISSAYLSSHISNCIASGKMVRKFDELCSVLKTSKVMRR